ncbi:hypothetical protein J9E96_04395 [Bordetella pertussis]
MREIDARHGMEQILVAGCGGLLGGEGQAADDLGGFRRQDRPDSQSRHAGLLV